MPGLVRTDALTQARVNITALLPNHHFDGAGDILFVVNSPNCCDPIALHEHRGAVLRKAAEFGFELGIAHRARHRPTRLGDMALEPAAICRLHDDDCGLDRNIRILFDRNLAPQLEHHGLADALVGVLGETNGAVNEGNCNAVLNADLCRATTGDIGPIRADT